MYIMMIFGFRAGTAGRIYYTHIVILNTSTGYGGDGSGNVCAKTYKTSNTTAALVD